MANYAALKSRIIAEMVRDDLGDDLAAVMQAHVVDACEEFADRRFWFNQSVQSVNTAADQAVVAVPVAMRIVDRVAGPYDDLAPMILEDMADYGVNPQSGLPTYYAYYDGGLRFDVTPDAVYGLTLYGVMQVAPPVLDTDSNIWTNEAQALIAAQVRMTLYRDIFHDPRQVSAQQAVRQHLSKIERETERRLRTRPVARLVRPNGRPIRSAYLDRL